MRFIGSRASYATRAHHTPALGERVCIRSVSLEQAIEQLPTAPPGTKWVLVDTAESWLTTYEFELVSSDPFAPHVGLPFLAARAMSCGAGAPAGFAAARYASAVGA